MGLLGFLAGSNPVFLYEIFTNHLGHFYANGCQMIFATSS
jgi:hypothetical protein